MYEFRLLFGRHRKHFACFKCRKAFKQSDLPKQEYKLGKKGRIDKINVKNRTEMKCPQCGKKMNNMGNSFRAPKQNDVKQWKVVETLYKLGVRYNFSDFNNPDKPKNLRDIPAFIKERKKMEEWVSETDDMRPISQRKHKKKGKIFVGKGVRITKHNPNKILDKLKKN
jgi:hypothetical protein